jgi:hypothetical protein
MRPLAAPILVFALAACSGPEPEAVTSPGTASAPAPAAVPLDEDPSQPGRTHVAFSFDELDLNDDGSIVETESAFDAALSENFAKLDQDGDGKLSRLEFDVTRAAARAKRK